MTTSESPLFAVRREMAIANIDALFVPRADEYLGEYIPRHSERLQWLTGFTGSAGLALILADRAAIFVDGRYTVQVRDEVDQASFEIRHLLDDPPAEWLTSVLPASAKAACDPRLHTLQWYRDTEHTLSAAGIKLVADTNNPIDRCWIGRPAPVCKPGVLLDAAWTGVSSASKRAVIAAEISAQGCDAALVFAPDSVSWLLNVRGTDMPQLPVLLSFALLDAESSMTLFVDARRLPKGFEAHVGKGVNVLPETQVVDVLGAYKGRRVLADPAGASAWIQLSLLAAGAVLVSGNDPVQLPKACKNQVELDGTRLAHRRDAVAVVRFLAWLDAEVAAGRRHDEAVLSDRLLAYRSAGECFHACALVDNLETHCGNTGAAHPVLMLVGA
ncbi:MAG: aminopeptidase P family N-terminal domain-containing protein, partial [Halioglobus sp.]|nr:aminopeptidase P family N-terminal domain-containing protein [Halioglobus sp.]